MTDKFDSTPNIPKNNIGISTTDESLTFKILTDQEAKEHFPLPLHSINGYLMNYDSNTNNFNNPYNNKHDNKGDNI